MDFAEKLRTLLGSKPVKVFAAEIGVSRAAINNYLNRGSLPNLAIAKRIADALGVPLDWFADDTRDFPAVEHGASSLSEQELMFEVVRRYRLFALEIRHALDEVMAHDWRSDALTLAKIPFDKSIDNRRQTSDEYVRSLLDRLRQRFDLRMRSIAWHDELPGREFKDYTATDPNHLGMELAECQKNPWLQLTRSLVHWRAEEPIPEHIKPLIEKTVAEIEKLDLEERRTATNLAPEKTEKSPKRRKVLDK